ncbi:hypothetical protein [Candidatus Spyradosoma sp. SGI.093]|uniref:hypothetical protein n=1 Tax=Candidatus Spyradosoma sp. SGI.093 TaxID=3420583 RepID=UPI003D06E09A
MKKSLLIFVLFALPFVHFLVEAHAETSSINQPAEVDWETVNWKEKTYKNRHPLSPEDAETMWKRIQKEPQFQALPQVFKDLIEHNKDMYQIFEGDVNTFVVDKRGVGRFVGTNMINLSFDNRAGLFVDIFELKATKFVDEPMETPAVNPKTKRPYVAPSNATLRSLKGDDLAYVKAFTEVVNRNIHYLGASPVPRLDMKRVKRGEYIGMYMWPLSLVQPQKMYETRKKDIARSPEQVKEYFAGGGDEVTYRLQNTLGTPLYNPRAFVPKARIAPDADCYGHPTPKLLGLNVVSLDQARQATEPERVLNFAYKRYFEAVTASCNLFKTGMESELNALDKKSPRGRAVKEVVTQAEKYLDKIEAAAAKCIENADKVYLNPPKTLLTAK